MDDKHVKDQCRETRRGTSRAHWVALAGDYL